MGIGIRPDLVRLTPQARIETALNREVSCLTKLFYALIRPFLWLCLAFQYAWRRSESIGAEERAYVLGRLRGHTTYGFGRFSDLWKYTQLRFNPVETRNQDTIAAKVFGLRLQPRKKMTLTPFTKGHCTGAVTLFCREYIASGGSIEAASKPFIGGMPLEAVLYHKLYTEIGVTEKVFVQDLVDYITHYPAINYETARAKWLEKGYGSDLLFLKATDEFLQSGQDPKEGGYVCFMKKCFSKQHGLPILGAQIRTVEKVSDVFTNKTSSLEKAHIQAGLAIGDVLVEDFPALNSSPNDVKRVLTTAEPGLYKLKFRTFQSDGTEGGWHTAALVISTDNTFHLFDPNMILPDPDDPLPRTQLCATIDRLFTEYQNQSTPSQELLANGYSLIKIHETLISG